MKYISLPMSPLYSTISPGAKKNVEVTLESWRRKEVSTCWKNGTLIRRLAHSSIDTSCLTVTGMSCIRS